MSVHAVLIPFLLVFFILVIPVANLIATYQHNKWVDSASKKAVKKVRGIDGDEAAEYMKQLLKPLKMTYWRLK